MQSVVRLGGAGADNARGHAEGGGGGKTTAAGDHQDIRDTGQRLPAEERAVHRLRQVPHEDEAGACRVM